MSAATPVTQLERTADELRDPAGHCGDAKQAARTGGCDDLDFPDNGPEPVSASPPSRSRSGPSPV